MSIAAFAEQAVTSADKTFLQLRVDIVEGAIPAGSKLSETELSTKYQVSRAVIREAINRLESCHLVSDGVGVNTPPHDHRTWAVIVGLAGTEFHVFYDCADANSLTETKACAVAKGDVLVMTESDIHAIDATRGMHPTWHVHLYGRSQARLPSFASRCYPTTD